MRRLAAVLLSWPVSRFDNDSDYSAFDNLTDYSTQRYCETNT